MIQSIPFLNSHLKPTEQYRRQWLRLLGKHWCAPPQSCAPTVVGTESLWVVGRPAALPADLCNRGCCLTVLANPAPCDQTATGTAFPLPKCAHRDREDPGQPWVTARGHALRAPSAPSPPHNWYCSATLHQNALLRWLLALTSPLPTLKTSSEGPAYTSDFCIYLALSSTRQTLRRLFYLFLIKYTVFLSTKVRFQHLPTWCHKHLVRGPIKHHWDKKGYVKPWTRQWQLLSAMHQ